MITKLPPEHLCDECQELGYCKGLAEINEAKRKKQLNTANVPEPPQTIDLPEEHEGGIRVCGRVPPF